MRDQNAKKVRRGGTMSERFDRVAQSVHINRVLGQQKSEDSSLRRNGVHRNLHVAPRSARRIDQVKRIKGLIQMAAYQKKNPHLHLNKVEKATWKVQWLWVILVLLTARAILLAVDDSDDPVTKRSMAWDIIVYAKNQAASIHSRFPHKPESSDENAALWGTYLG